MQKSHLFVLLSFFMLATPFSSLFAQEDANGTVSLFIKCDRCDANYFRQELNYLNHVRDQAMADIFIQINRIRTAGGGEQYELIFTGQEDFSGQGQHLEYSAPPLATEDDVRRKLVERIEAGLMPFLIQTPMLDQLKVSYEGAEKESTAQVKAAEDPWNFWIYNIYVEGDFNKETSDQRIDFETGVSADRVTENWRIRSRGEINYSDRRFSSDETSFTAVRRRNYIFGSVVRSLGDHWSAGLFGEVNHSTYSNIDLAWAAAPAVEYSIYPYDEVIRREITVSYRMESLQNNYIDTTIFNRNQEHLFQQSLNFRFRFRQPWGDIFTRIEAAHFLHDFSKHHVELDSFAEIRVWKGLAVRFSAELEYIRDQIGLPKGDASLEDILLRQRQIATDFQLSIGLGISYTFGSAFTNIVNTRL